MKYASGACCPRIPREREINDEYCYDDVDFIEQQPEHQRQQAQIPDMAYVSMQVWKKPYEREIGFQRGAILHALDKPLLGDKGAC